MLKLPLTLNPEETFQVVIFDILYNFRQLWNVREEFWTLDIYDKNNEPLVLGVKLVNGIFLLSQYPQVEFDLKSSSLLQDPTRNDLTAFSFEVVEKNV
jgi:hypothetical protein